MGGLGGELVEAIIGSFTKIIILGEKFLLEHLHSS